ncbi:MAG TPA: hypothetical protein VFW63_00160 [Acidimicrobiales bacterium]|nr:hypothetical protein [Acidimicrobiales bacterium]
MVGQTYGRTTARTGPADELPPERTGWVGWIVFASVMMIIAGTLNAIHGLVAIVNDDWVVWGERTDLYIDLSQWGWIHLVVGVVVLLAGIGVLTGNVLARTVAVIVAGLAIVGNFLWLPAYPLWSLTIIAVDVFVIYALTAHGREMA